MTERHEIIVGGDRLQFGPGHLSPYAAGQLAADYIDANPGDATVTVRNYTEEEEWGPQYEPWRHGGWYVTNVHYPSGACGCVSRNFADRKWRIVCHRDPFDEQPTFRTRDEAARAEREYVKTLTEEDR